MTEIDEVFCGELTMKFGINDLVMFVNELMSNGYIVKLEKISGCQYQIEIYRKVDQK